ncbi:MAG TPA: class I SAM-dependent rRNA methyltransferase [Kiritimatiellia bacterium]|nr:class I SAM-dependent rRNA methyltransferase [Kiritimatiellia bacterium]
MNCIKATLKPGRDKPVALGHPWIFSGAIASWSGPVAIGQNVDIVSSSGEWLARGLASPHGNLAVRVYSRDETVRLDADFFLGKIAAAISWRESIIYPREPDTDAFRLCYSESDGLSGVIIDRYADHACLQFNTSLLRSFEPAISDYLETRGLNPVVVHDLDAFHQEGATAPEASLPPSESVIIKESGFNYSVDFAEGQKTGFYLDQRENRRRVAVYAKGRRCLSAYCYTGSFELHLARAGANGVIGVDRSEDAVARAKQHADQNNMPSSCTHMVADVPEALRKFRDRGDTFDMIVLDPPKFVHNQKQLEKGLRAYKDINRLAMKLLAPGGILGTFSCSGWVKRDVFLTALEWSARDAGRTVQVLERLDQPPDHPVRLSFPESDYLCGYILRVE